VVTFDVYTDYFNYRTGIYTHVSGSYAGNHANEILGWGVTSTTPKVYYWIAKNSWGTAWGENGGYWRIKMGECGFDSYAYLCEPNLAI
jgi:cathepsin B